MMKERKVRRHIWKKRQEGVWETDMRYQRIEMTTEDHTFFMKLELENSARLLCICGVYSVFDLHFLRKDPEGGTSHGDANGIG